jgi:hypothetical protein
MKRLTGWFAAAALVALPGAAMAAPQTYHYLITHSRYGRIGAYDRVVDASGGAVHAQSQMKIAVKVLGMVMHRETADQSETWRDGRLVSMHCVTTVNGKPIAVSGEARGGAFMVTSPTGTATAPLDVAATDPMGFNRLGHAQVVSLKSGKLETVDVTGGETDQVSLPDGSEAARHFRVSTANQPNKWEVWLDDQGVPIKFRSLEHGDTVDFTLTSVPPHTSAGRAALAMMRTERDER